MLWLDFGGGDNENAKRMRWFAWWRMCVPKNRGRMGFRDLHAFNLAMLAKQVWRLIINPNSLCAKISKAKYYPNSGILMAGPKKGSSFTWQSIFAGIQTFRREHIWHVGNGSSINIWEVHWIPLSPNKKVITRRGQILLKIVDELMSPIDGTWDEDMLTSILTRSMMSAFCGSL